MSFLSKYKEKECKTWVGKFFQRLVFTWTYKIIVGIILVVLGAVLINQTEPGSFWDAIVSTMYGIGLITICGITSIFIIYAWIINPIRNLKKKK